MVLGGCRSFLLLVTTRVYDKRTCLPYDFCRCREASKFYIYRPGFLSTSLYRTCEVTKSLSDINISLLVYPFSN